MMSNLYVSNWKSSYDVNNEMAQNIARVKLKTVKLSFLFNSENSVIHSYPACPFTLCRGFFTPKIVGTFYMQGYKVKEKTAIVPPVSKLSGHPGYLYNNMQ